ncbi:protease HtpX [Salisediminibacterium halotolerans]|uniref:Protease HtpX homolog n=1 Tax=Salisediminibacterium halotolerans TaxID=517425 RepID=A0A1H9WE77_9BACI|nr:MULTISPECIES: protease HtpX [Salisediminibacterium]RLJ73197.1 heat shock protein [Actinophytocola xinjiangensis]RPE86619.1 heat shock protein [Salisediminibacterium halotolerans]TWG33994.1 heat shock protein [Salisediminibacterium halotolerans]SES32089.1 heat shock protein HtpX [Salisediminibacterium haloalkalitolerans]GEL06599.1 protease HtpX [Salisediminibacterium halotolerans]
MGKRFLLFLLTNILVMTTVVIVWSIITSFTDIGGQIDVGGDGLGINLTGLAILSILIGFIGSFFSLAISRIVAKKMMRVKVLDPEGSLSPKERAVVDRVHTYARRAGMMHMPEVGIYNSQEVNAFATGPTKKRSLVAVSSGLLDSMDGDAIEGVLAHEVAHISNGDMVTMTLLQGVVNTFVVFFSRIAAIIVSRFVRSEMQFVVRFAAIIVFQILFSILGSLVVMAYSRHREYHADRGGADLAGKDKMAHALRSLQSYVGRANVKDGRDDSAVQTMKINGKTGMAKLFSSHPDIEERLARLERM